MSVDPTLLKAHYDAIRAGYKVAITHTGGVAVGKVTSITASGIKVDNGTTIPFNNITGFAATP